MTTLANQVDPRLAAIASNIKATITKMRRQGTVGASMACLKQCTPTTGVYGFSEAGYNRAFQEVALVVAKKFLTWN